MTLWTIIHAEVGGYFAQEIGPGAAAPWRFTGAREQVDALVTKLNAAKVVGFLPVEFEIPRRLGDGDFLGWEPKTVCYVLVDGKRLTYGELYTLVDGERRPHGARYFCIDFEHAAQFSKGVNVSPRPDNVCLDAIMEGGTTRDTITMSRAVFARIILQLRKQTT